MSMYPGNLLFSLLIFSALARRHPLGSLTTLGQPMKGWKVRIPSRLARTGICFILFLQLYEKFDQS